MVIALYVIALAMIGGGAAAVAQGYGIVLNERGWTMVISGTVAASAGFLLLGIAAIAGRLKRVERELTALRERTGRLGAHFPPPAPLPDLPSLESRRTETAAQNERREPSLTEAAKEEPPEHAVAKAAELIPEPAPAATPASAETKPAGPSIVGTYNSGGNAYVMYSDGSIEADTPTGRYRFHNLDELKEFIAAGGESGAARQA